MQQLQKLARSLRAGGALTLIRAALLPVLVAWTVVAAPAAWPAAIAASLLFFATHYGRRRGWWPLAGALGAAFALAVTLWMPLLTGGWRSLWLLEALLELALLLQVRQRRVTAGALGLWALCVPGLAIAGGVTSATWGVVMGICAGVPLVLWAALRSTSGAAQATAVAPERLERSRERFRQIESQLVLLGHGDPALAQLRRVAAEGAEELGGLIGRLDRQPIAQPNLVARMQQIIERWREESGLACAFMPVVQPRYVPPVVHNLIVRALQETLRNIASHARASHAEVELRGDDDQLVLIVRDNGVGLVGPEPPEGGCHGLRALRYQLQEINGGLELASMPGGGLVVQLTMPLAVYAL